MKKPQECPLDHEGENDSATLLTGQQTSVRADAWSKEISEGKWDLLLLTKYFGVYKLAFFCSLNIPLKSFHKNSRKKMGHYPSISTRQYSQRCDERGNMQ